MTQASSLVMRSITKSFPGVLALDKVDFEARGGEVTALVGANGAGKSTLMKVLSGVYESYEGEIWLNGKPVSMVNPILAKKEGILCIYQEVDTSLVPYLSVTENVLMDRLAVGAGRFVLNWNKMHQTVQALFEEIGTEIDVRETAGELSLSEKQLLLIARALSMEIKFLILDEPTAPLSVNETKLLFTIIRRLREKGVGIIYISHRLNEVLEITDRITVMKNGQVTANLTTAETTREQIIEKMLGQSFAAEYPKLDVKIGAELMRVENMRYRGLVNGVSFTLHEGEILGIAGLVGAGKTELSKIIFGALRADAGRVLLCGIPVNIREPHGAIRQGISLIPEERRREGVLVDETVATNLTIASLDRFTTFSYVRRSREKAAAGEISGSLKIKTPSLDQQVKNLSGGNQQKVAVGKWLIGNASVYLFDEPTKGIDVGAKTEIFRLVGELAQEGKGIVYLSNELEEILGIADRILVMYDGEVVSEMSRQEATLGKMLYYCTGGNDDEQPGV